jgi:hypothetical protein
MGSVDELGTDRKPVDAWAVRYDCFLEMFAFLIDHSDHLRLNTSDTICLARRAEVVHFWLTHFEPPQLSVPV